MRNQRGAVSIFLLLLFLAIFFFHAVFIDYARVLVAMKQSEANLKQGTRSVMSAYDVVLKELYGLYGTTEKDQEAMLLELLQLNTPSKPVFFNVLDFEYDEESIEVAFERSLGEAAVFEQQILEEMKYKAPIDFTLKLIDKMSPISIALGEASSTLKALQDMQELYEEREQLLRDMLSKQQEAYERIHSDMYELMTTQETIYSQYSSYVSAVEEYNALLFSGFDPEDEEGRQDRLERLEYLRMERENYEQQGWEQLYQLQKELDEHEACLREALTDLEQARRKNKQMKQRVEEAQNDRPEAYEIVQRNGDQLDDGQHGYTEQISELKQSVEALIADTSFFEELEESIRNQQGLTEVLIEQVRSLEAVFSRITGAAVGEGEELGRVTSAIVQQIRSYQIQASALLTGQRSQVEQLHEEREKSWELEKQFKEQSKQTSSDVKGIIQRIKGLQGDKEQFEQVDQLFQEYLDQNQGVKHDLTVNELEESADKTAQSAMKSVDTLFSLLGETLLTLRNELYLNEYTLSRFNHVELQELKSAIFPEDAGESEESEVLKLDDLEVEYILYGFRDPVANVAAALTEILILRLALHSIDAFISCARTGHPFAVLACVVSTSFLKILEDLKALVNGEAIKLTQRVPILLTYQDHLHLFLFLHPSKNQLHRIQALIHHQTGKDLNTVYTYVSTQAEVSFRLWFLPGVLDAISYLGGIQGKVEKGRFYITKQAHFSY